MTLRQSISSRSIISFVCSNGGQTTGLLNNNRCDIDSRSIFLEIRSQFSQYLMNRSCLMPQGQHNRGFEFQMRHSMTFCRALSLLRQIDSPPGRHSFRCCIFSRLAMAELQANSKHSISALRPLREERSRCLVRSLLTSASEVGRVLIPLAGLEKFRHWPF
jgi:hypothetical protein